MLATLAAAMLHTGMIGAAIASSSPNFDRDCGQYYREGLDPDVAPDNADSFCACLAREFSTADLGTDALDFFARTYSDDLTTFIHEYAEGEAWMEQSLKAEPICKGEIGTAK